MTLLINHYFALFRVAQLEQKKDSVTKIMKEKAASMSQTQPDDNKDADSDASEDDIDDMTDWRKKC